MDYNWLKQETPQIILFRNEKWYKKAGVFHNVNGPAIKALNSSSEDKYFIKGKELDFDEWEKQSKVIQRRRKIKKIDKLEN